MRWLLLLSSVLLVRGNWQEIEEEMLRAQRLGSEYLEQKWLAFRLSSKLFLMKRVRRAMFNRGFGALKGFKTWNEGHSHSHYHNEANSTMI